MTIKALDSYIDACLIDEYADKDLRKGYSLDVDSLPDHEISNLLDRCMQEDTYIRDFVLSQMQDMINSRLPICEDNDRAGSNVRVVQLSNGDMLPMRGAA